MASRCVSHSAFFSWLDADLLFLQGAALASRKSPLAALAEVDKHSDRPHTFQRGAMEGRVLDLKTEAVCSSRSSVICRPGQIIWPLRNLSFMKREQNLSCHLLKSVVTKTTWRHFVGHQMLGQWFFYLFFWWISIDHLVGKINAFFQLLSPIDEQLFILQIFIIADHVQRRMLKAHQRGRKINPLAVGRSGTQETRPWCRGVWLSTRHRKRTHTRHTLRVTSDGHRRSRHVNGEGLGARRLSTGYARPRSLCTPAREVLRALPYPWSGWWVSGAPNSFALTRLNHLLDTLVLQSIFSYELRHKTNTLFNREHDRSGEWPQWVTASLSFLGINYSLIWVWEAVSTTNSRKSHQTKKLLTGL